MAHQLTTAPTIYKPTYNPDTNTFYDDCPFLPNSRNASKYGYKILNPISKLFFPPSMWLVKITKFELK